MAGSAARTHASRAPRPIATLLALLAGSAITLVALLATRPHLSGRPDSWSGDDLALACVWGLAVLCSAWLALTTLACAGALAHGHAPIAHRIAGWAPPLVRRTLQTALVGTFVLVPTAAYAASPPTPLIVHVGKGGRLSPRPEPAASTDVPVVRTPETTTTASTTTTTAVTTPPSTAPPPTATVPRVTTAPGATTVPHAPDTGRVHVVRAGDNLWRIARAEVVRTGGVDQPGNADIAHYWHRVIAANRTTLRSRDPSLIYPGELVTLPRP